MMHERSLVMALLKQVDAVRHEQGGGRVTEVRLEVGPLSGVEPLLLSTAFDQLVPDYAATARLVVDDLPLLARCKACEHEFEVEDFVFRCPRCSGSVRVMQGESIQLVSVSLQSGEPTLEATP